MVIKEIIKLNEVEYASLNFDHDSHKVMQKYLSSSTILIFEENYMLDDVRQEIMEMYCQDRFDME